MLDENYAVCILVFLKCRRVARRVNFAQRISQVLGRRRWARVAGVMHSPRGCRILFLDFLMFRFPLIRQPIFRRLIFRAEIEEGLEAREVDRTLS